MKSKLLLLGTVLCLFLVGVGAKNIKACTIFTLKGQQTHYFASNEDWTYTDPAIRFVPGSKGNYAYLIFGWESFLPNYAQGGVNEYGICLDWASLTPQPFKENPQRKPLDEEITVKILKKCKTIAEVIELIKSYNCNHFAEEHLLVSDRNDQSCIIEWSGVDYVFLTKYNQYQIITNFAISNRKVGWYPCERFNTGEQYLKKIKLAEVNVETIKTILDKTHQEGTYQTIYSYIVDQRTLDIFIYFKHNYSKSHKINFVEEIKKGQHQIRLYNE